MSLKLVMYNYNVDKTESVIGDVIDAIKACLPQHDLAHLIENPYVFGNEYFNFLLSAYCYYTGLPYLSCTTMYILPDNTKMNKPFIIANADDKIRIIINMTIVHAMFTGVYGSSTVKAVVQPTNEIEIRKVHFIPRLENDITFDDDGNSKTKIPNEVLDKLLTLLVIANYSAWTYKKLTESNADKSKFFIGLMTKEPDESIHQRLYEVDHTKQIVFKLRKRKLSESDNSSESSSDSI